MKQFFNFVIMALALTANSQNATPLMQVHTVKPMMGKRMAFEAAYKQHVARFHKTDKVTVYQILSGKWNGYYHVVSETTFDNLDKERPDATVHDIDLDQKFNTFLEDEEMSDVYRFVDSLSIQPQLEADKYLVNVRHIKSSMLNDYRKELRRATITVGKLKSKFWERLSVATHEMLWSGSDPTIVSVRNLPDGFKSLETDFYGPMSDSNPTFKDEYIKAYGTLDWDKRVKLLEDAVVSSNQYIMKLRKDLSSQ